jgi:hypothetical protein
MRRQERETMEHNEYSGAQLYMGGRRYGDDLFSYKKMTFYFNRPCDPNVDSRSRKVQKILKSVAFSRRNQDLTDPPVIKSIGMVICLK